MVSYLNHCQKYASFTFVFVQRSWKYLDICLTCCTQYFMVTISRAPTLNETVFGYTCMPCTLFSLLHSPLSAAHIFIRDIKYLDTCLTFYTQYYIITVSREPTLRETFSIWTQELHSPLLAAHHLNSRTSSIWIYGLHIVLKSNMVSLLKTWKRILNDILLFKWRQTWKYVQFYCQTLRHI